MPIGILIDPTFTNNGGRVIETTENPAARKANGMTLEEQVIGIVAEKLQVPIEKITRESLFVDDLKADSLEVVELVMGFEDEFNIVIPDDDYDKIRTVGDAIDYITEKI